MCVYMSVCIDVCAHAHTKTNFFTETENKQKKLLHNLAKKKKKVTSQKQAC